MVQIGLGILILMLCAPLCAGRLPLLAPLEDQFGNHADLTDHAGQVQLAIVVSAKRLRRIKPWEKAIRSEFEAVPVVRVADVPGASSADHADVADKLRRRLPEDVPVLIDLDGVWAGHFDLNVTHPSLLLFDAQGRLVGRYEGMFKQALYEPLRLQLQGLLETQSP